MGRKDPKQSTAAERTARAVLQGPKEGNGYREVGASRRASDRAAELRRKGR